MRRADNDRTASWIVERKNLVNDLFTLEKERWYAWEMLPGYTGSRYYSPIRVENIQPLQTGRGILELRFWNACYAEGVQSFVLRLMVLHRGQEYMIVKLLYGDDSEGDRCGIISPITSSWLQCHFPEVLKKLSTSGLVDEVDLQLHLERILNS